jgi:hypothetical protein
VALASRLELAVPDVAAMNAHLRDIEAGTLFLRSSANPPVGEPIEVSLLLPGRAPLVVTGKVSRIDADGFGLTLDAPSDAVRAALTAVKIGAPPADLPAALARLDALGAELHASREKVAQLQRESETNRTFYAGALAQATMPLRGRGPRWGHFLAMGLGGVGGVVLTLGVLVARAPEPAPPPPQRTFIDRPPAWKQHAASPPPPAPAVPLAVQDAGTVVAAAAPAVPAPPPAPLPAAAPAPAAKSRPAAPDDSGALNLITSGEANVFVDGRAVGRSPVRGVSVKPGEHAVRFECLADTTRSAERKVNVPAFAEVDVEHACP